MLNANDNKVSQGDKICATLVCNGQMLASACGSAFNGIDDVTRRLLAMAGRYVGMARMTVRNTTRGWQCVRMVAMAPQRRQPTVAHAKVMSRQYLIPWAS